MGLPRAFVGFSSVDYFSFVAMLGWKANEHIDFDFCNVQLSTALDSADEDYIKRRCREQINRAGTYALLIGQDTWKKTTYVKWEVEVAIEKECRLIGINLDKWRAMNPTVCPLFYRNVGALFVPFSPHILAYALQPWERHPDQDWFYTDDIYLARGYTVSGNIATYVPKPKPWLR